MTGSPSQRLGVAAIASRNLADKDSRTWCEEQLKVLFSDDDAEVRRKAGSCFSYLKSEPLETFEELITIFCDSQAYQEGSYPILSALESSGRRLPGITCTVCERFLERFSDEAKDIRTGRFGDVAIVSKLLFRTYHQHQRDPPQSQAEVRHLRHRRKGL